MKNFKNLGFLSFALVLSGFFISQTNAEILGMRPDEYPSTDTLNFTNLVCEVRNVYEFEDDSSLNKLSHSNSWYYGFLDMIGLSNGGIYGQFIGQRFKINRETGTYRLKGLSNDLYENTVVDMGSKKQSYKVISKSSGRYVWVKYINVDVYKHNGNMSFKILDHDFLLTGLCKLE